MIAENSVMQQNTNYGQAGQQQNNNQQPNPQNSQQQQNQQQAAYQFHLALKAYFYNQGQSIHKLYSSLDSNIVARGFKNVVSVLLEVLMYCIVVTIILVIIAAPNTPFEMNSEFNSRTSFSASVNVKEITQMIIIGKVLLFLCSLPAIFCAVLLHRNRNKGNLIRKAFEETKQMKSSFDKALRDFNL